MKYPEREQKKYVKYRHGIFMKRLRNAEATFLVTPTTERSHLKQIRSRSDAPKKLPQDVPVSENEINPVLWNRIQIGSVISVFVDSDPYSEFGSRQVT